MSFFVSFTLDASLSKADAKALAARLTTDTGFPLFASGGLLAKSTNCLFTTDSGDIFVGESDSLVPSPGIATQIDAVVASLLKVSPRVAFCASWMGEASDTIQVDAERFSDMLHRGTLAEGMSYLVHPPEQTL